MQRGRPQLLDRLQVTPAVYGWCGREVRGGLDEDSLCFVYHPGDLS